jgi:hypothetical protein
MSDYFEDQMLLKAFAMDHEDEYIEFCREYLEERETEASLNYERENSEI